MSRASDKAYSQIRELIISGDLAPGEALGEEALAEMCDVSRTPIREALRRLEADMLIRKTESQRSYVSDWSLDDVHDVFELRAMLEGYAARRAAELMDDAVLKALKMHNSGLGEAVSSDPPNVEEFLARNREFHALILRTAASPRLEILLQTLIEQPVIWRTAHHYELSELVRSHQEHDELIAAFERGDGPWAEASMTGHIRRAFHAYSDAHREMMTAEADQNKKRA